MGFLTFRGGIHPDDGKALSKEKPITAIQAGPVLYYSTSQHIGAPAKPVVSKGDHVRRGTDVSAEAGGFVSAPVHATVSGTVKGIEKMRMPGGNLADCIVVENDGQMEEVSYEEASLDSLTKEEILKRITQAGIVGMGGAGFPTHVKLAPKNPEAIDYILVNGAECEPYLTSDYRRMLEEPEKLVAGLQVILKIFPKAKGCICIEDNKPDCIRKMEECTKGDSRIEVKTLKTKYPQGAERMLIYAVTGREDQLFDASGRRRMYCGQRGYRCRDLSGCPERKTADGAYHDNNWRCSEKSAELPGSDRNAASGSGGCGRRIQK